jgi:hypothetical protein
MPSSSCPFRSSATTLQTRTARPLTLFGRLAPGAALSDAQRELSQIGQQLHTQYPGAYPSSQGFSTIVASLHKQLTRRARPTPIAMIRGSEVKIRSSHTGRR